MFVSVAARFAALAILLGASRWLDQSLLVPVAGADSVTYYACLAPPAVLATDIALVGALLVGAHFAIRRVCLGRRTADRVEPAELRYLAPLALGAANLLGVTVLDVRLRDLTAPLAYIAVDLHPMLQVMSIALAVAALWQQAAARLSWRTSTTHSPSITLDLAIAAAVIAFAIVTTPHIRFSARTTGDEPKYVRFAENWFQGKGMQIDQFVSVKDLPDDQNRVRLLDNLAHVGPMLRENLASARADLATLADPANWRRSFNRAESADNHVVRGKNGWHYQIHGPGLSLLILPTYLIDRTFFDSKSGMFADDLFATTLFLLLLYAALALVVCRLAMAASAATWPAVIASLALMLSLPVAAFPFQFYPEIAAGLITCGVALRLLRTQPLTVRDALLLALSLTLLGWLHVRFLAVAAVEIVWLLWTFRASGRRALAALVATLAAGMSTLCFYAYHVTGSLLPSAPFALGVGSGFVWDRVPVGLFAMLFDRMYGLLPLAPAFLLAVPGSGLMAQRQPRTLALIATVALALIVPSAGQGYWTDGSVPLRHALAVLPLAAVPLALWLDARGHRPLTAAVALLAVSASVRTAIAYNLQNDKTITTMLDAAFAGWDVSLFFPITHRIRFAAVSEDAVLMLLTTAIVFGWFAYGALSRDDEAPQTPSTHLASRFAFVALGLVLVGMFAIALGAPAHRWELLRGYRRPAAPPAVCWIEIGQRPPRRTY